MPELTERERLSQLETKLREEIDAARLSLRARYAAIVQEFPESPTERELRERAQLSIQLGGTTAIAALKPLLGTQSPGRKPAALRQGGAPSRRGGDDLASDLPHPTSQDGMTMTLNDIVAVIAAEEGLAKTDVKKVVDALFAQVTAAAEKDDEVSIPGFGKFKVKNSAAREGRNPSTGETISIAASKKLGFAPAKALKDKLNG